MEPLGSIMENMPDTKPDILVELKLNMQDMFLVQS